MVASRTALVVGGITFPVGLILTIVGAAYYGDEYSTCSDAKVEVAGPWCKVGGTYEDNIYDATGAKIDLASLYIKTTASTAVKIGNGAANALSGNVDLADGITIECTYSGDQTTRDDTTVTKCDILDDECKLKPELEDRLVSDSSAAALEFFQNNGTSAVEVAAAKPWCYKGDVLQHFVYAARGDAAQDSVTGVWNTVPRDFTTLTMEVAAAGAVKFLTASENSGNIECDTAVGVAKQCEILNTDCTLKTEYDGALYTDEQANIGDASLLTFTQIDGATPVVVETRRLQTAVGGAFRKLNAVQDAMNKSLDAATDAADDACDADFAAMVAMCVIGGILMVVGLVFFVIWGKYSSDAESK